MQILREQLNVGDLIEALSGQNPMKWICFDFGALSPGGLHSDRGQPNDLAIGYGPDPCTAGGLLKQLEGAVGRPLNGFRRVSLRTPGWVANHGELGGTAVVGIVDERWRLVIRTEFVSLRGRRLTCETTLDATD